MRLIVVGISLLSMFTLPLAAESNAELREQVRDAELAFAATMATRNHEAFVTFIAEEAIFLSGGGVLRGREAVVAGWKRFYVSAEAPFSWTPETVEVIDSGTLAVSTGPVFGPDGRRVGTFNSTWKREADGSWKVILDGGCPPCDCAGKGGG